MRKNVNERKYRLEVVFFDRNSDKITGREAVEAPTQFTALIKLFRASIKYDPQKHYIIVKTNGCSNRPEFIIKNLRRYGIDVIEPLTYSSGEKSPNWSELKEKGYVVD